MTLPQTNPVDHGTPCQPRKSFIVPTATASTRLQGDILTSDTAHRPAMRADGQVW
ncbi:hypothetical protein O9993_16500 [Vibrio lentus]|nr:hypothetical protein [Vibrio lentus]